MSMTPKQIDLARHALGLPNSGSVSYRNRFVAGESHPEYWDWYSMTKSGDAKMIERNELFGGSDMFYLTEQGAKAALQNGEKLDKEDFPLNQ